jgi:small-conductance mechanosensitive channel
MRVAAWWCAVVLLNGVGGVAWGQDAGGPDVPVAGAVEATERGAPVNYHEETAFRLWAPAGNRDARARARDAQTALGSALEAEQAAQADAADALVTVKDATAQVWIRGYLVAVVYPSDAQAAGYPDLESFAAQLTTRLLEFVPAQMRRGSLQKTVLHVFLSVFLGLLTVLAMRQLRSAFDQADHVLEQRREHLSPLTVGPLPVLSGNAVGGALAILLEVGRWLAFAGTLLAGVAAVMSQFEGTRPWLQQAGLWGVSTVLKAVQAVGGSLPSLVLAALLVLAVDVALRFLNLLLDGVRTGRVTWGWVPPFRVTVARRFMVVAIPLLVAPLVVASAFGRFGTPLETLSLVAAGVVMLAALPALAASLVGGMLLWRQAFRPGDWVQVGSAQGELTEVRFTEMVLVPEEGGTLHIPALSLLWNPARRLPAPTTRVNVRLARSRPVKELVDLVAASLSEVVKDVEVECALVGADSVVIHVVARSLSPATRHALWMKLAQLAERGDITLLEEAGA